MGILFDLSKTIDDIIQRKGLDRPLIRGKIALKAGVLMYINEKTPDDHEKIRKIREAVKEILGIDT